MNLVNDFVRLKLAAFDLEDATEFESNQVIDSLQSLYLDHLGIELENTYYTLTEQKKTMEETQEDLFKKFYNDEKILVSSMSTEDFRLHEEELAKVAFEAKARITALVDHKREQNQKLKANQKEWLVSKSDAEDQLVSDAINASQSRKKRMNKAERLEQQMKDMGLDDETIRKAMANITAKATEKQMNVITFVGKKVEEVKKEEAEAKVEEPKETVAFDPSKLVFGKK